MRELHSVCQLALPKKNSSHGPARADHPFQTATRWSHGSLGRAPRARDYAPHPINESVERYLRAMDTADRAEPEVAGLKKERLQEKIEALKERMKQLEVIDAQMRATSDQQISLTDPDARS